MTKGLFLKYNTLYQLKQNKCQCEAQRREFPVEVSDTKNLFDEII